MTPLKLWKLTTFYKNDRELQTVRDTMETESRGSVRGNRILPYVLIFRMRTCDLVFRGSKLVDSSIGLEKRNAGAC